MTDPINDTILALGVRLQEAEAKVQKLRAAIAVLQDIAKEDGRAKPQVQPPTNGTLSFPVLLNGRPLLRDGIPAVLREHSNGLTLQQLAADLWHRHWVGGETEPSIETVRGALKALEKNGVVVQAIPEGSRAAIWRLSDRMLPAPPRYSQEEEERGI